MGGPPLIQPIHRAPVGFTTLSSRSGLAPASTSSWLSHQDQQEGVQTPSAPTTRRSQAPKPTGVTSDVYRRPVTGSGDEEPNARKLDRARPRFLSRTGEILQRDLAATRISKGPDETGQPAGVDDPLNFLAEADPHLVVSWVPHLFPLPGAAEPHVLLEAVAAAASPPGRCIAAASRHIAVSIVRSSWDNYLYGREDEARYRN